MKEDVTWVVQMMSLETHSKPCTDGEKQMHRVSVVCPGDFIGSPTTSVNRRDDIVHTGVHRVRIALLHRPTQMREEVIRAAAV